MASLKHILLILLGALTLTACHHMPQPSAGDTGTSDTLSLRYAKGFLLITHDNSTEVQILDPWHPGRVLQQYTLSEPLQHAAVFTAAHAALLDELGYLSAIAGVCEPQYIADAHIHEALRSGTLRDLGSAMTPDLERLIALAPDALLLSPFENAQGQSSLQRLGIPLIWCADYMESSALGRAEWMRLFGRLFGCGERADSLFSEVEKQYLALAKANSQSGHPHPTVLFDGRNGSAWYMPGGQSTLSILTHDAGGDYIFADNKGTGSVPFAFEEVFAKGRDADVWLYRYTSPSPLTLTDLRQQYEPYAQFRAFLTGRVYGCNNADNLFFEEYPFHPERLLADLTHIFAGDSASLRYFHPLQVSSIN